jgi:hypothetical protein
MGLAVKACVSTRFEYEETIFLGIKYFHYYNLLPQHVSTSIVNLQLVLPQKRNSYILFQFIFDTKTNSCVDSQKKVKHKSY